MMRRSSGMGGGRMLRAMGRSVGASVKDKMSSSASAASNASNGAKAVPVVSVSDPPLPPPLSSSTNKGSLSYCFDLDEWETIGVDDKDEDVASGFGSLECYRYVFGSAPSKEEAEEAVSTIQQIFVPITFSQFDEVEYPSSGSENVVDKVVTSTNLLHTSSSDWIEPAQHLYSSRYSHPSIGQENILDAVLLLQTNQPFKRMVTSLSSDPAVWDAVMKNEVVQELKKSFYEGESDDAHIGDEDENIPEGMLGQIMDATKGKIMDIFHTISKLISGMFHFQEKDQSIMPKPFDDLVRSSLRLSVVVFIIVVVTRIQKA